MASEYHPHKDLLFRYQVVDFRELDGRPLLDSDGIGDNVVAILARLGDQREAVRHIVGRIARMEISERQSTLEQLLILAGLRHLGPLVKEEANRVPITENIWDHEIIGPVLKKGLQQGLIEGEERGLKQGLAQGERIVLRRLIAKRFGAIPAWLEERLAASSASDLEALSDRVLDAQSMADLVK